MTIRSLGLSWLWSLAFALTGCDDYDAYPDGFQGGAADGVPCIMPMDPGAPAAVPPQVDPFWGAEAYDPAGAPAILPPEGHHMAMTCLPCHSAGSADDARDFPWAFAGTVRVSRGGAGRGNVQIGVRSGGTLYVTYTSSGGHFWLPTGPAAWGGGVEVRMRDASGERVMAPRSDMTGDCNECHGDASKNLVVPD